MTPLTLEQQHYKERTLNQLLANLPQLQAQLAQETQREAALSLQKQLEEVETHMARLQNELAQGITGEPVADELCRQAAYALTKQKLYMARKYINKLEAIEPFHPELPRLKQDLETDHISRRTRSLAQGEALPLTSTTGLTPVSRSAEAAAAPVVTGQVILPRPTKTEKENGGLRQFFQFHYIASCLILTVLFCVMAGVGGMSLLRWLIEGS
jgi:hypothetical protein